MQKSLKDILSNPPNGLGSISVFLLIVGAVSLASIFLVETPSKDIMLNLSYNQLPEQKVQGATQLSKADYDVLSPMVSIGQDIKRNDTLFTTIAKEDIDKIMTWKTQLAAGQFRPTAEMLKAPFLTQGAKRKMISLAKLQSQPQGGNSTYNAQKNKQRRIEVEQLIEEFRQEVISLTAAIPKFKLVEKMRYTEYINQRNEYEKGAVELEALKNEREKLTKSELDTKQREGQLKTAKLRVREYESELDYLIKEYRKGRLQKPTSKANFASIESAIVMKLDSILSSNVILSSVEGKVKALPNTNNISIGQELVQLEDTKEAANRSKIVYATAKKEDGGYIYPNANLLIALQDGSTVKGVIVENAKNENNATFDVQISSEEVLSYADIDQILIPSKNSNFIEKVLDNF